MTLTHYILFGLRKSGFGEVSFADARQILEDGSHLDKYPSMIDTFWYWFDRRDEYGHSR